MGMRLLTRSDFDGLACGALLLHLGIIDNWKFVHPKDVQDGLVEVTDNDVLANIPYAKGCKMWFDHHLSELERIKLLEDVHFEGESRHADSAARVIYEYYGGDEKLGHFKEMVEGVDKVDSGKLTKEEILNPTGWVLLGFLSDPRSGLGRFRNFRIPNYKLMEILLEDCQTKKIDQIMEMEDIKERVVLYKEQSEKFVEMLRKYTTIEKNLIVTDLRGVETIYTGNRFLIYSIWPNQNISMWIVDGREKINCPIAVGHSILNRTSKTNVGSLLLKYNGGGHKQVGTCQVPYEEADKVIKELVKKINEDG